MSYKKVPSIKHLKECSKKDNYLDYFITNELDYQKPKNFFQKVYDLIIEFRNELQKSTCSKTAK